MAKLEDRIVKLEVEMEFYKNMYTTINSQYMDLKSEMEGLNKSSHTVVAPTDMIAKRDDPVPSSDDIDKVTTEGFLTDDSFEDLMSKVEKATKRSKEEVEN